MVEWTGKTIGGYHLVALRAGNASEARFDATGMDGGAVTLRLLAPPQADDRWFAERVAREMRRYVGVIGPHLAPLLAVGEAEGHVYLVGPPLHGETLRARLGLPRPLDEVIRLLEPLAAALDALHTRWLPHGGVRPEAILLTETGPFLRDAGLTPALEEAARLATGARPATTTADPYRAPEHGDSSLRDPRADIYSLAALAWEALTGQPPAPPTASGHTTADSTLPPTLAAALQRGLARSPYERPDRASGFVATLRAAATEAATSQRPPAPPLAPYPLATPLAASSTQRMAVPETRQPEAPEALPSSAPPRTIPALPPAPSAMAAATASSFATHNAPSGAFAEYRYTSAPVIATPRPGAPTAPNDPALLAARTQLVTTLGALATMRGELIGTLRAVALARGGVPPRGRYTPAQRPPTKRREAPERRAARYVDNWREVYGQTTLDTLRPTLQRSAGWIAIAVVAALFAMGPGVAALLVVGIALVALTIWLSTPQTALICTADGFVVERGTPFRQPTRSTYRWDAIAATSYGEIGPVGAHAGKEVPAARGHFFVHVGPAIVFDQHDTLPPGDFARLIERFSWMTPQLPYEWIPAPDGRFRKVARDRLRDGV